MYDPTLASPLFLFPGLQVTHSRTFSGTTRTDMSTGASIPRAHARRSRVSLLAPPALLYFVGAVLRSSPPFCHRSSSCVRRRPPHPEPNFTSVVPSPASALLLSLTRALACLPVDPCAAFLRPFSLLLFPLASPTTRVDPHTALDSIATSEPAARRCGLMPAIHLIHGRRESCIILACLPPLSCFPLVTSSPSPSLVHSGTLAIPTFRVLRGSAFPFRCPNSTASSDSEYELVLRP
ncbi:hypothetical protein FB451DRAFT_1401730 [Mycena latifolia]|nr:hypothetical protein FB451DRAFT_1401730 [Mycena latifolia]